MFNRIKYPVGLYVSFTTVFKASDNDYLYAMAALAGPVRLMNSKRAKPAPLHHWRKSFAV
jgi:hypothetical protein